MRAMKFPTAGPFPTTYRRQANPEKQTYRKQESDRSPYQLGTLMLKTKLGFLPKEAQSLRDNPYS